jgi:hypothetical protein
MDKRTFLKWRIENYREKKNSRIVIQGLIKIIKKLKGGGEKNNKKEKGRREKKKLRKLGG